MPKGMGKRQLVDRAFALDQEIKALQDELSQIKGQLKGIAALEDVPTIVGHNAVALFSANTTIYVDPLELKYVLQKLGKEDQFLDLIKVDNTKAKKVIGPMFDAVAKRTTDKFGKVSFKSKG